eukprot:scaffold1596_cov302-Pinguiococcus_pyrenoidosus.AAC.14
MERPREWDLSRSGRPWLIPLPFMGRPRGNSSGKPRPMDGPRGGNWRPTERLRLKSSSNPRGRDGPRGRDMLLCRMSC